MSDAESPANGIRKQRDVQTTDTFAEGGPESFTQVFAALKKGGGNQRTPKEPPYPALLNHERGEGEFTQLLHRVSRDSHFESAPVRPPAPMGDLRVGSPSEFTQVVLQSMLRETSRQSNGQELPSKQELSSTPRDESQASQAGKVPAHLSSSPDRIQATAAHLRDERGSKRLAEPHSLVSSVDDASRIAGGRSLNSHAVDQIRFINSAEVPAATTPAKRPDNASGSRLDEYAPLLLITNLFVTVLLLLLVAFALLHR